MGAFLNTVVLWLTVLAPRLRRSVGAVVVAVLVGPCQSQSRGRSIATSITTPDTRFMTRTDYDADGRPVGSFVPRYDGTSPSNPLSDLSFSDPNGGTDVQASQCKAVSGGTGVVPAYPASVGVCVTTASYDPAGRPTRVTLPTAGSNRYIAYTYTDDSLLAAVDSPSPTSDGARVTTARTSTTAWAARSRPPTPSATNGRRPTSPTVSPPG